MKAELTVALCVLAIVASGLSPVLLIVAGVGIGIYTLGQWLGGGGPRR